MMEWLFKYPASSWREGSLGFDNPLPLFVLAAVLVIVLAVTGAALWKRQLSAARKTLLFAMQGVVATVLLIMLWQPVLQLEASEQGENTVAWIVDVSQSMQTQDVPVSRSSTTDLQTRLAAAGNVIKAQALDDEAEFEASLYAQGSLLQAVSNPDQFPGIEPAAVTNLAQGLDELLGTVGESALAAVVVLSDGSDNAGAIDAQWWQRISAAGVPVHTVGIGRLSNPSDIQLSDVTVPQQVAAEIQYTAVLKVAHATGGVARVRVFSGRDLIAAQDIDLPSDVSESLHRISLPSGENGIQQLRIDVRSADELLDNDLLNNTQTRIVRVTDSPKRILYVEGEPRWEYKFLRRALDTHPGIEIVSLLRTSPNKFYRQGVRDAQELAEGFPLTREQLFAYDAVIIGSLEAAELNTAQQLALRDFVSVRGGSLLMLAGRHGLADGGWGRSVVAAALPVILDARLAAETFVRARAAVVPTVPGYRTQWLSLANSPADNLQAWQGLPEIADVQTLGAVKPGAVVLLERTAVDTRDARFEPLLVSQRYGKGKSLVMGTSGTWRWQMGLDSTDQRHEMFWRQLTSHLVDGVVPRISVSSAAPVYRDVDTANVSVNIYDTDYEPLQQTSLPAQLSLPDGSVRSVELQANMLQPGNYLAQVDLPMDGPYTLTALTPFGGESPQTTPVTAEHWWVKESGTAESFDNVQQQEFLQRLAESTGGSYLLLSEADSLADVLAQKNAALKREVSLPLWNLPALFLLLILAKLAEWFFRLRWKRL